MSTIIAYHSTDDDAFEPRRLLHVGSLAQARMRGGRHLVRIDLDPGLRMPRLRDHGSWSVRALMRHARRSRLAVYLNRHEGIPLEEFEAARTRADIDRLTDRDFRRLLPSAEDSWIVLDTSAVIAVKRIGWP